MKKILVVLLILAVTTGVFAQWTQGGRAELGTNFNLDNGWLSHGRPINTDATRVDVEWKKDGATLGLRFQPGAIIGNAQFEAPTYAFQARGNLFQLATGAQFTAGAWAAVNPTNVGLVNLWGWYKMLDGMIHLEAAYLGRDVKFWMTDETVNEHGYVRLDRAWARNGLLANITIAGLQFGAFLPNVFDLRYFGDVATLNNAAPPATLGDFFLPMVVGIKFEMDPFAFSTQFRLQHYEALVGIEWKLFPELKLGMSFEGRFDTTTFTKADMVAGLNIAYDAGFFGAGLKFLFAQGNQGPGGFTNRAPLGLALSNMGVAILPSFWYKVIPNALRFDLGAGFAFGFEDKETVWRVEPALAWNFRQNGAEKIGDVATGMGAAYFLEANEAGINVSRLEVRFRWRFF